MRIHSILVSVAILLGQGAASAAVRELGFDDRVRAQRAIDRVYYDHQVGGSRPFEEAVSERKVADYLAKSAALEDYWGTPVTAAMLRHETERMIRESRRPERLQELFAALGHDALLVQECLARPTLVDRLIKTRFDRDERIHGAQRREMERIRAQLSDGTIDAWAEHPLRSVAEFAVGGPPAGDGGLRRVDLDAAAFRRDRDRFPRLLGGAGQVEERRLHISVSVLLGEERDRFRVARFELRKTSWTEWWSANRSRFEGAPVESVASPSLELGLPTRGGAPSCLRDDSWDHALYAPRFLSQSLFVWTGTEMLVWSSDDWIDEPIDLSSYDPATDTWSSRSEQGAPSPRYRASVVWTGNEMIVWGGRSNGAVGTGGRYDPVADGWTPVTTVGAPTPRYGHTAVWTGSEMVVWGGEDPFGNSTGARYDPQTDSWTPTSTVGAPSSRSDHTAVWTGDGMIVWGGLLGLNGYRADGGVYDPATDSWTPLPDDDPDAPIPRTNHAAVWSGSEMIVAGGRNGNYPALVRGGRFDPVAGDWTETSTLNAPPAEGSGTSRAAAVWSGSEMLFGGGADGLPGKRYDPATDTWTDMSTVEAPSSVRPVAWGDGLMLTADGTRYEPTSDSWTPSFLSTAPSGRQGLTTVWTGNELIAWGGYLHEHDGGRYDPATHSWVLLDFVGFFAEYHTALWTGTQMIVAGGRFGTTAAALYDPLSDDWDVADFLGQPMLRRFHSVVWTGSEMIVWGGDGVFSDGLGDGSRYDPATDVWEPTSMTGAPTGRSHHRAVWTGSEMIVWGGEDPVSGNLRTGSAYDPATDIWRPTSLTGAPSARSGHSMLWTGSEALIWGGTTWTGGRYDPVADAWTDVSTTGAPPFRTGHHAEWTGAKMIVWGGATAPVTFTTEGGVYDPVDDGWVATSLEDAPVGRGLSASAWAGDRMYILGGTSRGPLRSGAAYLCGVEADLDDDGVGECSGDCDDFDPTVHPGAEELCDLLDNDCNLVVDDGAGPPEVAGLRFAPDAATLSWDEVPFGLGTVYDVARGALGELPIGSGSAESCLYSESEPAAPAAELPAPGEAFWYLVRGRNDCGTGSYGEQTNGPERATPVCP